MSMMHNGKYFQTVFPARGLSAVMSTKTKIFCMTCMLVLFLCGTAGAETFTDLLGRKVVIKSRPERIVSMAPSLTEILYYLGLGDRVVGVTQYSNYPEDARSKPNVGSYVKLNVEKIVSLSPDLAVGTVDGNREGIVKLLDQAGIPAFIVNPRNVEQTIETVQLLGRVCGVPEHGEELASKLKKRVDRIVQKVQSQKKPRVFVQINTKPIMTVNHNTVLNDLIRLAGGINLFADEPITYPRISLEAVLKRKPDVIILAAMVGEESFDETYREWMKWDTIPAVKNKRVYLINSDLTNRPSPRIVDGLEMVARLIHPEIKWE